MDAAVLREPGRPPEFGPYPDPGPATGHTLVRVTAAPVVPLDLLTERQREIVFLHYYADLDYAAIADALQISPGTVGATLNAARRTLRAALEEVSS